MPNQLGFNLVELILVVAIIGIIAAIGTPVYKNHVATAKRSAAQAALLEIANIMERQRLQEGAYGQVDMSQFHDVKEYNITTRFDAKGFTVHATPSKTMTGDGRLYINHLGRRCWNKLDTDTASCDKEW